MRIRTAAVTLGVAALVAASSAPAVAAPPSYGIPPNAGGLEVAALVTGRIALAKADAAVDMPIQTLRVYAYESSVRRGSTTVSFSRSWIVGRAARTPVYGSFAPVRVSSHAAGVHVVATITQVQVVDPTSATYLPLGISNTTGLGETVSFVSGPTLLRLSAVRVDGVPVDVGPGCGTSLRIGLRGEPGFDDLHGGLLQGLFTVPAFTGCDSVVRGTGATLTSAFSGRGNLVTLARGAAGTWDTTEPGDCDGCGPPPAIP